MTHRMKFWLGVSTAALLSGALPVVPAVVAPMLGADLLVAEAEAQESGEGEEGGEGTTTECTTEDGEGEEGGETECPKPEGEGEEGEGEGG
jgi:hypothetical protein